jgi:hypothetical protein
MKEQMYKVVCYIETDQPDDAEPLTMADAIAEADQAELMQPENIYVVRKLEDD